MGNERRRLQWWTAAMLKEDTIYPWYPDDVRRDIKGNELHKKNCVLRHQVSKGAEVGYDETEHSGYEEDYLQQGWKRS